MIVVVVMYRLWNFLLESLTQECGLMFQPFGDDYRAKVSDFGLMKLAPDGYTRYVMLFGGINYSLWIVRSILLSIKCFSHVMLDSQGQSIGTGLVAFSTPADATRAVCP